MLENRYGHFEQGGRAFTVTDAGAPMPWSNVVCNGRYGFVVSHNGGGFSWFDDAQHNVLTRWEMDLVRDCYGKFLYVSDLETGEVWSLAPSPCRPAYERYQCTHEPGRTTFRTAYRGIEAVWTMAVAPGDPVEVWQVEVRNAGPKARRLRISSYFEWTCGVAPDSKREFHRLFFNTNFDAARRAMIVTKNMWDIRPKTEREHWNQPWPYFAAHAMGGSAGMERTFGLGDKSAFLGRYGSTDAPKAMRGDATPATGGFGRFGDSAAALGGDLALAPGATAHLHWTLAIAGSRVEVETLVDRYKDPAAVSAAIAAASDSWDRRLAPTRVETEREDFDLLNNTWLPYQAISGRLWGRTGYYQQSGAFGFRDQLQDSQVWLPIEPQRCLDQILLHASRQFADGSVYHWWHALADFGNHTACSDDYLWLPKVVAAYLRETGDYGVLHRRVAWVDDATPATLREHCHRALARAFKRTSPRGLPLIGSCDWNDGLSAMGIGERGESVWLGMFLCHILDDWAVILDRAGDHAAVGEYLERRRAYAAAINAHAWDDAGHYRYGTKDSGEWVGASSCAEGKVHLNAQTWAILADVASPERAERAWGTVKQRLLSPYGPLLLWPAYTVPDPDIGYVTRYSPGSRENGGVYMHAATWALAAAACRRDREAVARIWDSISPPMRGRDADAYWAEPYVTPGNVDGPLSDKPGRAGWTWYTGSAAWLNRVSLEWVLGIRPTFDGLPGDEASGGLLIDPCPSADLGRVSVTRTWRGRAINVSFDSAAYDGLGRTTLVVNGRELEKPILTERLLAGLDGDGRGGGRIDVEVRWSRTGAAVAAGVARSPDPGRA